MGLFRKKTPKVNVEVDVCLKDRFAQLLIALAVVILAAGIAISFAKGMSTITLKASSQHPQHHSGTFTNSLHLINK